MTDLARILATHPNVEPTMVVTPSNANLIRASLDRFAESGHKVQLLTYPFPSVGLPPGVENLATVSPPDEWRIYKAVGMCRPTHDSILLTHMPDAVIADIPFHWVTNIAAELAIPRITFHAVGVFPQLVMNNLYKIRPDILAQEVTDCSPVCVPDLPGPQISLPMPELPDFIVGENFLADIWGTLKAAQLDGFGVIVNTFHGLEPDYCEMYKKVDAKRAYFVGPVALSSFGDTQGAASRGGYGDVACLDWLDGKEEGSVVFVCFGSWCRFTVEQLRELALGLENSGRNFLWVVRGDQNRKDDWMPEGWEKRVESRGLIIRGWAPQVAILGHKSVGAFLTHCGWNSVLEATSAGVPMLTWPLVFEQFINERLVVDVKRCGIRVWEGGKRSTNEELNETVPRDVIAETLKNFMESGGEGEKARSKAKEVAVMAKAAMDEVGSSRNDLNRMIDDLMNTKKA
ncbi:hypothetical protein LUZ60_006678 [Juncus effusus]|nr:hypothetical protein LUZ60_006678 [Juncus effusus]